jgi:hypothetical protein
MTSLASPSLSLSLSMYIYIYKNDCELSWCLHFKGEEPDVIYWLTLSSVKEELSCHLHCSDKIKSFLWVILRHLNFISQLFGALCLFQLCRWSKRSPSVRRLP